MNKKIMSGRNKKRKERSKERRFLFFKYNSRMLNTAKKLATITFVSLAVLLVSYAYNKYKLQEITSKLETTLSSLLRIEKSFGVLPDIKIALGFGSCQDIIVQSNQVILDRAPEIPEHFESISTKEELLKVFAYFYQHGAAAERFVSNSTLFQELVRLARKASSSRSSIGGNAPLMSNRFVKEGCQVLLGAHVSPALQSQFPDEVLISGPVVEQDDVHLLLEYPAGQRWGSFVPPRANRFIIHNDHQNPELSSLNAFVKKIEEYNPNLLVIAGLQMMDNFPMSEGRQREHLQNVQKLMKKQPNNVRIHFEMASFSDENLLGNLVENIIPYADSLGMNEQELPSLFHMMKYGNMTFVAESRPRIAVILDEMRDVFELLKDTAAINGRRRLTRLHLHTLAFQAFMIDRNSPWKNTKAAAAKAALTANRHTCGSEHIDTSKSRILMDEAFTTSLKNGVRRIPMDKDDPVSCWTEDDVEICVAPVLVCNEVVQTGGGGDNVSSAGLVLQI